MGESIEKETDDLMSAAMIWFLRGFFALVLLVMLGVTTWASRFQALWDIPREVGLHPWFVATLCDAYFGFLTFYVWLAYKERSWVSRGVWLLAILCLGNLAMATYMLWMLWRLPAGAPWEALWLREKQREGGR